MNKIIITIGRQFGSGGREIGKKVAADLGIEFFDKDLIKLAAKNSGISEELFNDADEKPINSFLYSIVTLGMPAYPSPVQFNNIVTNDKLFSIQADVIKKIAEEKSAVIIGRCADDILRDNPNVISVFIHANKDFRINRVSQYYNISTKEASETVRKVDKSRSSYYEFFANKKWGATENYHLAIDSSIGIDKCASVIKEYVRIWRNA